MSSIIINDLAVSKDLDGREMSAVRGGALGTNLPFANVSVSVGISQTISQFQGIEVNALNNVGVIGADLGFNLGLHPSQIVAAGIAV